MNGSEASQVPAGWYPDPAETGAWRYWDGANWTGHTATPPEQSTPGPGRPPAQQQARQQTPVPQQSLEPATHPVAPTLDVYNPTFDVSQIPDLQRDAYKKHELTQFPVWLVVVLHFITLGIFTFIYHGLKHSRLPLVKSDDFRAGKGIGFLFIPFFNFYWVFVFWLRLADRINFQYRLRNEPPPVNRGLVLTMAIFWVIQLLTLGVIPLYYLIFAPIVAGQIQSAANKLAAAGPAVAQAAAVNPAAVSQIPIEAAPRTQPHGEQSAGSQGRP